MAAKYTSKHGIVSKSPFELYMSFVDMRNFVNMLPEDRKACVTADFDNLTATVQGMTLGVRVTGRVPYNLIQIQDNCAPFHFGASLHFDQVVGETARTDFWIEADADLNFMMKAMLGNKLQEGLDRIVDGLAAVSEGRMPEGVDPSMFRQ